MNKGVIMLWTVMLGANLGLSIYIARWIIHDFKHDVKDAIGYDAMGTLRRQQSLLLTKQAILDSQKESEASLKKYITEQLSEDKTLGSTVKLGSDVYVITSIAKNCTYGEAESADVSLRKAVE